MNNSGLAAASTSFTVIDGTLKTVTAFFFFSFLSTNMKPMSTFAIELCRAAVSQAACGVDAAGKAVPDFCKAHERVEESNQCASVCVSQ